MNLPKCRTDYKMQMFNNSLAHTTSNRIAKKSKLLLKARTRFPDCPTEKLEIPVLLFFSFWKCYISKIVMRDFTTCHNFSSQLRRLPIPNQQPALACNTTISNQVGWRPTSSCASFETCEDSSCCITGQLNTLRGKHYFPSSQTTKTG